MSWWVQPPRMAIFTMVLVELLVLVVKLFVIITAVLMAKSCQGVLLEARGRVLLATMPLLLAITIRIMPRPLLETARKPSVLRVIRGMSKLCVAVATGQLREPHALPVALLL